MRGLRIKNLVCQNYDFVIQFFQVTELLSVEKEHNSIGVNRQPRTINRHHRDQVRAVDRAPGFAKNDFIPESQCFPPREFSEK